MNISTSSALVPVLVAVSLVGAGCWNPIDAAKEKVTEGVVSGMTGGKVKMDATDGGAVFTDPETGSKMAMGEDLEIPASFPKDVPIYAGAKAKAIVMAESGDKNATISLATPDAPKAVADWYDKKLKDGGWTQTSAYSANGSFLFVFEKDTAKIAVTVASDSGAESSSITIIRSEEKN
jgi:hypothetical protein